MLFSEACRRWIDARVHEMCEEAGIDDPGFKLGYSNVGLRILDQRYGELFRLECEQITREVIAAKPEICHYRHIREIYRILKHASNC